MADVIDYTVKSTTFDGIANAIRQKLDAATIKSVTGGTDEKMTPLHMPELIKKIVGGDVELPLPILDIDTGVWNGVFTTGNNDPDSETNEALIIKLKPDHKGAKPDVCVMYIQDGSISPPALSTRYSIGAWCIVNFKKMIPSYSGRYGICIRTGSGNSLTQYSFAATDDQFSSSRFPLRFINSSYFYMATKYRWIAIWLKDTATSNGIDPPADDSDDGDPSTDETP